MADAEFTFVGYAIVYTIFLPRTPQNIVIGGASGAMPPVLGWAAVTGEVTPTRCCCSSSSLPGRRRTSGHSRFIDEGICEALAADAAGDPRRPSIPVERAVYL